jgi:hypothetical protein
MNVHKKDKAMNNSADITPTSCRSPSDSPPYSCSTGSPGSDGGAAIEWNSPYRGVRYRKEQQKWVAEIRPPKSDKTWWLGTYSSPEEAAYAYDVAICYFKSETALNFEGHPLYTQLPTIPSDLPRQDYAVRLRKVIKDVAKQAMSERAATGMNYSSFEGTNSSFIDTPLDISEIPTIQPDSPARSGTHPFPVHNLSEFDHEMAPAIDFHESGTSQQEKQVHWQPYYSSDQLFHAAGSTSTSINHQDYTTSSYYHGAGNSSSYNQDYTSYSYIHGGPSSSYSQDYTSNYIHAGSSSHSHQDYTSYNCLEDRGGATFWRSA